MFSITVLWICRGGERRVFCMQTTDCINREHTDTIKGLPRIQRECVSGHLHEGKHSFSLGNNKLL